LKILYASGNHANSYHQLSRYLPLFHKSKHQFQVACYKQSLGNLTADYCLDALLNFIRPSDHISYNGNYSYYCKELLKFKPDLIISDLEIYTSIFAIEQNIPLWQVSSSLLYYALPKTLKQKIGLHKYHAQLISGNRKIHQYIRNILNQSTRKFVLSHLCDIPNSPKLSAGFEWCRPEFQLSNSETRSIYTNGLTTTLSDAFYNQKYPMIINPLQDIETLANHYVNQYFDLNGSNRNQSKDPEIQINSDVKFLMEMLS
jgi:hypothetical protein